MLLCIDTGNTQTVIGLFDGTRLADHWRIATIAERTADEMALMIQQFLGFHGFTPMMVSTASGADAGVDAAEAPDASSMVSTASGASAGVESAEPPDASSMVSTASGASAGVESAEPLDPSETQIDGVAISSGVPRVTVELRAMTERYFGFDALVLEPGVRTGMPILYDNPKEVGPDRIANAVAAYDQYGGPSIVVDFGTANTIEAISENGEYLGGAIFPGIEISMDALFARAAALRRVELIAPRNVIGKSTVESIQAGTVYGFSGQIDALVDRFQKELGQCTVIATGGLAEPIIKHSRTIQHYEPWLTLQGLRIIFERNR